MRCSTRRPSAAPGASGVRRRGVQPAFTRRTTVRFAGTAAILAGCGGRGPPPSPALPSGRAPLPVAEGTFGREVGRAILADGSPFGDSHYFVVPVTIAGHILSFLVDHGTGGEQGASEIEAAVLDSLRSSAESCVTRIFGDREEVLT